MPNINELFSQNSHMSITILTLHSQNTNYNNNREIKFALKEAITMKQEFVSKEKIEIRKICNEVRELVKDGAYEECYLLLKSIIGKYPHAPEPHNFFGILLEKEGNHLLAMKHFEWHGHLIQHICQLDII